MTASNDGFISLNGQDFYRIANVQQMPPFLASVVSDSDHWMYISSRGGLTCGRVSEDHALFPYETDDKLHTAHHHTGPLTLIRVTRDGVTTLWQPFHEHVDGRPITRNLYKSAVGNEIIFEEIREDLALAFRYRWSNTEGYGFVRSATLENRGNPVAVEIIDGLVNLMPAGVELALQRGYSCLANAYTRCDVDAQTLLATFSLSALIVDQAKPVESLKATVVWSSGLDNAAVLLTTDQVEGFRVGEKPQAEYLLKGRRGNYLLSASLKLAPGASRDWLIVADVERTHHQVESLRAALAKPAELRARVRADIDVGTANLIKNVAGSDGLQSTADHMASAHHFANVLFNNMRGGVFADHYRLPSMDFSRFLNSRNKEAHKKHGTDITSLPADVEYGALIKRAGSDATLSRLTREYLPLTFGRRHGDPSRPWNRFAIKIKNPDGSRALNYQGNWRDIFQNWEALTFSYPEYIESIIAKFVNASTADGFNPYRITRDGIDWEAPNAEDPWANIGYWGDHQIVYLLKFLEHSRRIHPGLLEKMLASAEYTYADVPYRIRPYGELVKNPRDTIVFDHTAHKAIEERAGREGADGKLMHDAKGRVLHATLAEKLLVPILSKLSNLVPDAGIWMNTQRPEWNDANNALVGPGLSMVTLAYLRRHLAFCRDLFAGLGKDATANVAPEVSAWLVQLHLVLAANSAELAAPVISPAKRRAVTDALGEAFSKYRHTVYHDGLSVGVPFKLADAVALFDSALKWLDHTIVANKREDGLYHSYNLLDLSTPGEAQVAYLYAMLEGQVAILSSGVLSVEESIALLETLYKSDLYRQDQHSFMLYPERRLPGYLQKNVIPDADANNPLIAALIAAGDTSIVARDDFGRLRFNSHFRTLDDIETALQKLQHTPLQTVGEAHGKEVKGIFERIFKLREFTGRSGTMYGYEGLGCIYWHMVSKLLLATQETAERARAAGNKAAAKELARLYYLVRAGLSFNKTARGYGAFPTDPYSHTPKHAGAQQPGMTGQVKEEILTRFGEFGVKIAAGKVSFDPWLLRGKEFFASPTTWKYINLAGENKSVDLPAGALGFTFCQVPVIFRRTSGPAKITVRGANGAAREISGLSLDEVTTQSLVRRDRTIESVTVELPESAIDATSN